VTYLALLAIMMALKGKDYYLPRSIRCYSPREGAVGAVCGVAPQTGLGTRAAPAIVLAAGLVSAPLVLPILPPERIEPYMERLGIKVAGRKPTCGADCHSTSRMSSMARDGGDGGGVYNALPAAERAKTAILAGNYGEAGAIDFFGSRYGLPKAISGHQNYYYWGPRSTPARA